MTAPTQPAGTWSLVEAAKGGDLEALAELYRLYQPHVLGYVRRRVEPAAVEDIAADVWVRALRNLGGLTYRGRDFGAWLSTIARNLITDHHRRAVRRPEDLVADFLAGAEPSVPGFAPDADARLMTGVAMAALTAEQREVIVLRYVHDLDQYETAALMHRSVQAVKALQHRATQALAHALMEGAAR